jgi:hypothetical protein
VSETLSGVTEPRDRAEDVSLSLTHDEALVIFEWLHVNEGKHEFADQAEQRVLWDLEASLERQVTALFSPDYSQLLDQARSRLRDPAE